LIRTGRADVMQWPPGSAPLLVPHGTGPSDMGRAELEAFWDDAREVIRKEVLPHVDAMAAEEIGRRLAPAAGSRRRLRTRRDSKVPKAEG
jgi:hypothetical protein